ncbi:hypothetical protein [Halorubrum salsamenti]|uniref:hypothetical protein n=1 Tax=Halorubrum salsamenti TaxID=2583990 RepID=UPI001F4F6AB3|nr:hypothetical protein [Halorubrum salsamenti]
MPLDEMYSMLSEGSRIRIAEDGEMYPNFETWFVSNDVEREALSNPLTVTFDEDQIDISPLELQIAYKLRLAQAADSLSGKDFEDALHLYLTFEERFNMEQLETYVNELGVEDYYAELTEFEADQRRNTEQRRAMIKLGRIRPDARRRGVVTPAEPPHRLAAPVGKRHGCVWRYGSSSICGRSRSAARPMSGGDRLPKAIATTYYNAGLTVDQLTGLIGAKSAQRLRLLKANLEDDPLDLAAPDDIDIYEEAVTTVDTGAGNDC